MSILWHLLISGSVIKLCFILVVSVSNLATYPLGIWPTPGRGAPSSWTCWLSCRRWRGRCRGPAGRSAHRTCCRSAQAQAHPSLPSRRPPDPRYCKLTWGGRPQLVDNLVAEHFIFPWPLTGMDHWPLTATTVHYWQFSAEKKQLTFALANFDVTRASWSCDQVCMSQIFKIFKHLLNL